MRDSFCKTGDRKAGKAGSGKEWGREPGSNLDIAGNRGALRTYREPGFGTGFPGEKGMVLEIGSYRGNRANPAVFPLPGERETVS
ncbi:hypothetical protein [Sphingobacterium sp. UBA3519]|uniref:hypothetical protein n=1 Tax=Sphingobacterium sp. UBA3519 TaxID=1947495 RepID=UPI00257D72FE|nr:hypothetical protein [Sphingobacterium sp. UBA3519]